MTPITRCFLKAGLIWLLAGAIGLMILSVPGLNHSRGLMLAVWHMLVMGWVTQAIIGVSLWMFPRPVHGDRSRENGRTWTLFWMLNTGLILRFGSEPFLSAGSGTTGYGLRWVAGLSVLLQLMAVLLYIVEIWPRIRGKRRKPELK